MGMFRAVYARKGMIRMRSVRPRVSREGSPSTPACHLCGISRTMSFDYPSICHACEESIVNAAQATMEKWPSDAKWPQRYETLRELVASLLAGDRADPPKDVVDLGE